MNEAIDQNNESMSNDLRKHLDRSKNSFQVTAGYFESRAVLMESAFKDVFEVPSCYFEKQARELGMTSITPPTGSRLRPMWVWATLAAAAMMVGFVYLFIVNDNETPTFTEHLEQTALEFEDLEEMEFEEDLFEEFIILDTLMPDTSNKIAKPISMDDFKPSSGQSVIEWEDIDAADIEEYLKDEESFEVIDEL